MFHAFGLTGGCLFALMTGAGLPLSDAAALPADPRTDRQGRCDGALRRRHVPCRLRARGRRLRLQSLCYVIAGAEALKPETRRIYQEKFGLQLFEGYGVTEAAPVLAVNAPMFNKRGTVGKLLPHITARIEPVPGIDEGGRLFVKGPNVMIGYYRADNPGELETPAGGWHDTAAAAAALQRELTLPEVAQSVVLTRTSGRASAMPASRNARSLRANRRHARDPPVDSCDGPHRLRTHADSRARLPGRDRVSRDLARRAHPQGDAGDDRGEPR